MGHEDVGQALDRTIIKDTGRTPDSRANDQLLGDQGSDQPILDGPLPDILNPDGPLIDVGTMDLLVDVLP